MFVRYRNSLACFCESGQLVRRSGESVLYENGGVVSVDGREWRSCQTGDTTANWNNDRFQPLLIHEDSIWRRNVTDRINHSITFFMKKIARIIRYRDRLSGDNSHVINLYKASHYTALAARPVYLVYVCGERSDRWFCSKLVDNNNKSGANQISA